MSCDQALHEEAMLRPGGCEMRRLRNISEESTDQLICFGDCSLDVYYECKIMMFIGVCFVHDYGIVLGPESRGSIARMIHILPHYSYILFSSVHLFDLSC